MEIKTAYILGSATILAAVIAVAGNALLGENSKTPTASIEGQGNNLNVVQGARDVTISQNVNEISKLREYEASSFKQSLVSGCNTMNDYFVSRTNFNVDSIDTLVGSIWVQKEKYISYFGPSSQRSSMEIIKRINPLYIKWMPGVYAMHNQQKVTPNGTNAERMKKVTKSMLVKTDEAQPLLVKETERLCRHLQDLAIVVQ
jgi:hypothetical protein